MTEYADQRAHDVTWMTAKERENYLNPTGQPFVLTHRLVLSHLGDMVQPACLCGSWSMRGYVREPTAHTFFARHCETGQ